MNRAPALTVKAIEALRPRANRYEVRDGAEPGLYVVVFPSGARSWVWRYSFGNKDKKLTLGPVTLAEARRGAREARHLRDDGIDPAVQKRGETIARAETARADKVALAKAITRARDEVGGVAAQFVQRHCANLRRGSEVARILRKEVVARWSGRRLSDLTRADIHELLDRIVDRGAPVLANRVLAHLNKLCRWAMSREIIDRNPCDGVAKPVKEQGRYRVLDDSELALVWRAAEQVGWPFGAIVQLLILTGQRRAEIGESTWHEIDFDAALLRLPPERTKNMRPHDCPLSPQVIKILKRLPRMQCHTGYLFTSKGRTAVSGFSKAKRAIDAAIKEMNGGEPIPAWTVHDLRRSVASGMGNLGVDLVVVERCLNHVSGSFAGIVSVYQKQRYEKEMRAALDQWGRHIERRAFVDEVTTNIVEFSGVRA